MRNVKTPADEKCLVGDCMMKCFCRETESEFVYNVWGAEGKIADKLRAEMFWEQTGEGRFVKSYPTKTGLDDAWHLDAAYKETISRNFAANGKAWIEGRFDFERVFMFLARKLTDCGIEWHIIGSASERLAGAPIEPRDIDICVETRDFYKAKELFREYTIEPFVDNKGSWLVRYFGKLCVDGASVDVAADEKMNVKNLPYPLADISWNGFTLRAEPLAKRCETETRRGRIDRISAIEKLMESWPK